MSLESIYKRLGMNPENGLCITKDNYWKEKVPNRLVFLIEDKLRPTAFFCFNHKPLILFYDAPQNKEQLFKNVWNFNESPIVIINEGSHVKIFNGFSYLKDKLALEQLTSEENLNDFSYFELITGKSLGQYQEKLKHQNRVDSHLLSNIRDARNILINEYHVEDFVANALIGKCIFSRYLIDRQVRINFNGKQDKWSTEEFCNLFDFKKQIISFFKYLREHFNGEAFLLNDNKLNTLSKDVFLVLKDLLMGTNVISKQRSLFEIYDFSIIPVEFISNVYEHFIGKENQAEKGAYYTPKFLVDYILTETVEKYFADNPKAKKCRVLDPACGSGIFLVEALRRIIEHNRKYSNVKNLKKDLKEIVETNVFGIDRDENAINVATFSIYLTLLDYLKDPKDIESFIFPNLIKNKNLHVADFFDLSQEYNEYFSDIKFDFILGNPPLEEGGDL